MRENKNGSQSLYLDYFDARGKRVRENLKIYLLPEDVEGADINNSNAWKIAEATKAERTLQLISGRTGTTLRRDDMLVRDVLEQWVETHDNANSKSNNRSMAKMLLSYLGENATLRDINRDTCAGFSEHLLSAKGKHGKYLAKSTARTYWQYFGACIGWAYRKGWLAENPCSRLERHETPKYKCNPREFLTIEELRRFGEGEPSCHYVRAYLFACYCGFRWSDLESLRWDNILVNDGGTFVRIVMQKTKREINMPLSNAALRWLPPKEESPDGERVFALGNTATAQYKIRAHAKKVGITKHLTFHTSRHTFGTSMLTKGADLYVTSRLMGHTSVKTTQIYANIVDSKKREAVDLLNSI
jgi:integrase